MTKFLSLLLVLSLALNAYLIVNLERKQTSQANTSETERDKAPQKVIAAKALPSLSNDVQEEKIRLSQEAEIAYQSPQALNADELFDLLTRLQKSSQFVELILPLREYLKRYPDDYRAWLIEADMILHTESLNVAIANYYNLLDKPLPAQEIENIQKIITVNTTSVIRQLTGDGAWELLATFLEPLIQIDPLNKRYILALARAYGQLEQFVLMENALAALPSNDARAQGLRTQMYQRDETPDLGEIDPNELAETMSLSKRSVPVAGNGEQFFVPAKIGPRRYSLLLDTGASTTAINQTSFERIASAEKEFIGYFNVQTAGGGIQAPLYRLDKLVLGEIEVNQVSVIILPDENLKGRFAGLLGMNVLRAFEMRFDPEKQTMTLFER
jgi:clan AA aspartic protease (TIGR02281 family)